MLSIIARTGVMNKACGSDGLELATKTKGATTGDRIVSLYLYCEWLVGVVLLPGQEVDLGIPSGIPD